MAKSSRGQGNEADEKRRGEMMRSLIKEVALRNRSSARYKDDESGGMVGTRRDTKRLL